MRNKPLWILSTLLTLLLTLPILLTSCGSGGQGTSAGQGTAAVLVKDAFEVALKDDSGQLVATITEVRIKISQILMKKEDEPEDSWVNVALSENLILTQQNPGYLNLLNLNNVAMVAAIGELPTGEYEKVRLVLDESFNPCIVLQQALSTCEPLKVPSHKIDIVLKPHVLVTAGTTTSIVLDFVPDKSIHINDTGSSEKYILRPVILAVTAELPDGVRVHHELSGVITGCTPDTITLNLRHTTIPVTIHYDSRTLFFSEEDVNDESDHVSLTGVTCDDLRGKRVEVKVLAMPNGTLHAVRVEIKGAPNEIHEIEEFQISGTLALNSRLTLKTPMTATEYKVIFPEGTVRVEGKRIDDLNTVLAREIETSLVEENFEVIGRLEPENASLTLTADGTNYTITFPPRLIKVEGTLNAETNTITAHEVEVFP